MFSSPPGCRLINFTVRERTVLESLRGGNVDKKLPTIAIHGGEEEPHALNSIAPPIFQTAIYSMGRFDDLRRFATGRAPELYLYTRSGNTTVEVAARKMAALEGAQSALVAASGSAAAFAIMISLLR